MTTVNKAISPYFDDYNESKNYYEILFRPKKSVQTRELNQIQSMFNQQIKRFASHVFKNGSVVLPGALNHDTSFQYVKIELVDYDSTAQLVLQSPNCTIISQSDLVEADLIIANDSTNEDPFTLFVRYTNSGTTNDVAQFDVGSTLQIRNQFGTQIAIAEVLEVGIGTKATIDAGVYFLGGRFVLVPNQTIIISKYTTTPNASIGLLYNEEIITENEDRSLTDNAAGFNNFTAPGAHRIFVNTQLVSYDPEDVFPESYVELMQIEDGQVKSQARGPQYNVLEQTLAQRTYEESGDYTVKPFSVESLEHLISEDTGNEGYLTLANGGDESLYAVSIDPGLAYVRGYRVELLKTRYISVPKSRESERQNNSTSINDYGQYIVVEDVFGRPNPIDFQQIDFYSGLATDPGVEPDGDVIGHANVRSVVVGTETRLHIFNIRNVSSQLDTTFMSNAQSVYCASGSSIFTANLSSNLIFETDKSSAIVRLNNSFVKTLLNLGQTDTSYTVLRKFNATLDTGGNVLLTCGSTEAFLPLNSVYSYAVDTSTGEVINPVGSSIGGSPLGTNLLIQYGIGSAGKNITVVTQVRKQESLQRSKTLTPDTIVGTVDSSKKLSLNRTDAFSVLSIVDANSNIVTDKFRLVTNARTNFYDISYVEEINGGVIYPITVQFNYFQHGAGDYFSVDSYSSIDYKDIPSFEGIRLSDCLDFRPDIVANNPNAFISSNDIIHTDSIINADVEYYLPRIDKVYVNTEGEFGVIQGESTTKPSEPKTPENALALALIGVNPYTINANVLKTKMLENKRFTMSDIGRLENRIENLEYYVSLSLLEQQTANIELYDPNTGLNRFKNGFFVDSFDSHKMGDWTWENYHVSVGAMGSSNALRPEISINAIETEFSPLESSNIIVKDGLAMLTYDEVTFISQYQATSRINVNPYAIYRWDGRVDLSPSVDNWIDIVYSEPKVNYSVIENGNLQQSWSDFSLSWTAGQTSISSVSYDTDQKIIGRETTTISSNSGSSGNPLLDLFNLSNPGIGLAAVGKQSSTQTQRTETTISTTVRATTTTTTTNTSVDEIADHLIARTAIPFIRPRDVIVKIEGMKPLTRLHFFFDGINVNEYVRPQAIEILNTPVVSDSEGDAIAVFSIPNNEDMKFKVGSRILEVTDSPTNNIVERQSFGDAEYVAEGVVENRMREFNATRAINTSSSSVSNTTLTKDISEETVYIDPLAQSFLVEQRGGVFLTSVEIFFESKDDKGIPVSLDIRAMKNGFPTQEIVPGSETLLKPSEVNVSPNASIATRFEFKYPVHLKQGHEYCFVLTSNSNRYYVWKATMSEVDVLTNEAIAKQPYIGVLFKSQNSSTWTPDQYSDLKFVLNRARFNVNTNGSIVLNNIDPVVMPLVSNPIQTYIGQTYIDIIIPKGHNYIEGANITLSGLTGGNGLTANNLNTTHIIDSIISPSVVRVNLGIISSVTSRIGGNLGFRTNQIQYIALQPNIETLTFSTTRVGFEFKPVSGQSFSGSETAYVRNLPYTPFANKTLNFFNQPFTVLNRAEEELKILGDKSFKARLTLSSDLDNVSPIVDLQRCIFVAPLFLVDNNNTQELDGSNTFAKYRTIPIAIDNPTTAMSVYCDEYVPNNSEVIYTARVANSKDELETAQWQLIGTSSTRVSAFYEEKDFLKEFAEEFTWFQFMIQLKSQSCADIPKVRNLRVIALGT